MNISIVLDCVEVRDDGTFLHLTLPYLDSYPPPAILLSRREALLLRDALVRALQETEVADATD